MSLVTCRYNETHRMKVAKLLSHEEKCPDKGKKTLKTCPYNMLHKMKPERFNNHLSKCPYKPQVDEDVEKEIRIYIEKLQIVDESSKDEDKMLNQMDNCSKDECQMGEEQKEEY